MVDALIRWWTLINFLAKFQGGRLFQCGRLLIFGKMQNAMQCFPYVYFLNCNTLQYYIVVVVSGVGGGGGGVGCDRTTAVFVVLYLSER